MYISLRDLCKKDVILIYRNDDDKRFHLAESQSMIAHVDHMFSSAIKFDQFGQLNNDIENNKVKIEILETCSDRLIRQIKLLRYRNDLIEKGYVEYSSTKYADVKVKLDMIKIRSRIYIMVYLCLAKRPKQLLGMFDKMDEARSFYDTHYPNGKIVSDEIVVYNNELTKKYTSKSFSLNNYIQDQDGL